jgi:hypoxanthine phosphoribosyltransferase
VSPDILRDVQSAEKPVKREILYKAQEINDRIAQIAEQITICYESLDLLVVSVLMGAIPTTAELQKNLTSLSRVRYDAIRVKTRGSGDKSNRDPVLISDIQNSAEGMHILVVEDIIDEGWTLQFLNTHFAQKNPASIRTFSLLDKPVARELPVSPDWVGFSLEGSPWVEGFGLDSEGYFRSGNDITYRVFE